MTQKHKTVGEYLQLDRRQPHQFEYLNGEVLHVTPTDLIANNLRNEIVRQTKGIGIRPYMDSRFQLPGSDNYCYPELAVAIDTNEHIELPFLIAEVVFDETEERDRVVKAELYRSSPNLRQILLISGKKIEVQSIEREGGNQPWRVREYSQSDPSVSIPTLGVELPIEAVYKHAFNRAAEYQMDPLALKIQPSKPQRDALNGMVVVFLLAACIEAAAILHYTWSTRPATELAILLGVFIVAVLGVAIAYYKFKRYIWILFVIAVGCLNGMTMMACAAIETHFRSQELPFMGMIQAIRLSSWMCVFGTFMILPRLFQPSPPAEAKEQ